MTEVGVFGMGANENQLTKPCKNIRLSFWPQIFRMGSKRSFKRISLPKFLIHVTEVY
jgi:hypothetical protein